MENSVLARTEFETECDGDTVRVTKYKDGTVCVTTKDGNGATTVVLSNETARAIGAVLQSMGSN